MASSGRSRTPARRPGRLSTTQRRAPPSPLSEPASPAGRRRNRDDDEEDDRNEVPYLPLAIVVGALAVILGYWLGRAGKPDGGQPKRTAGASGGVQCDFIIVGGGTGGGALAGLLSESNFQVCVIERGPPTAGGWTGWYKGYGQYEFVNPHDPQYFSTPQLKDPSKKRDKGKLIYVPRFRGLGGTSRIYGTIVRRASPDVLQQWPKGWQHDDLTPYYMKVEDHYCHYDATNETEISARECSKWHGKGGPMQVNGMIKEQFSNFSKAFKSICDDPQSPWGGWTPDYNGELNQRLGCSTFQQYKIRTEGRQNINSNTARGSSFTGYLTPDVRRRPNLHIWEGSPVTRILFERKSGQKPRAIGVEYMDQRDGTTNTLTARLEVIVAGGAYDTPHILQVSGVGNKTVLERAGIAVVAENNAVGANLWDHISVPYVLQLKDKDAASYSSANGPFSWILHINTGSQGPNVSLADIQIYFMADSPLFSATDIICKPPVGADHHLQATVRLIHQFPGYRGTVHPTTASIFDRPRVDMGWKWPMFERDRKSFMDTIEYLRSRMNTTGWGRLVDHEVLPGEKDIDEYLRTDMVSALHPACTCAMGTCADGHLRVNGVTNLRVCDTSAFATQVDGNPVATILAMAHKLADDLKHEYAYGTDDPSKRQHVHTEWRRDFDIPAAKLWSYVGVWKGKLDDVPSMERGSMHSFQLPGLPRMYEELLEYSDKEQFYTYTMLRTEPPGLPGIDYVSTKKVISTGHSSSAWIRTARIISDPNEPPDRLAQYIIRQVFASGGERLARKLKGMANRHAGHSPPTWFHPDWRKAEEQGDHGRWLSLDRATGLNKRLLVYVSPGFKGTATRRNGGVAAYDMDGTLISTRSGRVFARDEKDWRFFAHDWLDAPGKNSEVVAKLREMYQSGKAVVCLSNQGGIGHGKTNERMWKLKVEDIVSHVGVPMAVVAAIAKDRSDSFRKPGAGMFASEVLQDLLHLPAVDKHNSFYVGDAAGRKDASGKKMDFADSDKQAAANAGFQFHTPEQHFLGLQSSELKRYEVQVEKTMHGTAEEVWAVIGGFITIDQWHPSIVATQTVPGSVPITRRLKVKQPDGTQDQDTDEALLGRQEGSSYRYANVGGPWGQQVAQQYVSELSVVPRKVAHGKLSTVRWRCRYNGRGDVISAFYHTGLDAVAQKFPATSHPPPPGEDQ